VAVNIGIMAAFVRRWQVLLQHADSATAQNLERDADGLAEATAFPFHLEHR